MSDAKLAVCYCLHDDHWFLGPSVESWRQAGNVFVFLSDRAWDGSEGDVDRARTVCEAAGVKIIEGSWLSEKDHREAIGSFLKDEGFTHGLIPDSDEVIEPDLLSHLVRIANGDLADRVYVHWDTYWKTPEYVIRPRERFTPLELIKVDAVTHVHLRAYEGGRSLLLGPEYGLVHHLSYAGPDERIKRKIETWGHREEVITGWFQRVWVGWDSNKLMRNLHPTHPEAYGFAEKIYAPEALQALPETRVSEKPHARLAVKRPSADVVIPLHGGEADIKQCLDSLALCQDLFKQVVVVDNQSPDGAAAIAESYPFVTLLSFESNKGFGSACNAGANACTSDVIVFLNSDTVVPYNALEQLLGALASSGSIGATGPLTNECGYDQKIEPTYTSQNTLGLFARDFANRSNKDYDAPNDMLVGFCLAVRRSAWDEIGGFDESFGLGTFEDNDLCYRLRRAGYRLVIAARAFVYHAGSKTLLRIVTRPRELLARNRQIFEAKWSEDLTSGFASHLSGLSPGRIKFDPARSPERRIESIEELAKQADISLCMIVRNEERVLGDCLRSARPFFRQIIIVDTGSTDQTIDIAKAYGAEVHQMVWPDSFADARNESLKHARGRWIFWMDADDTLPLAAGEAILNNALLAPDQITAFVVPVQFVDQGPASGTRVDHVKLFRNGMGIHFEGRIHEQNLPSISRANGKVARSSAIVLHTGYDTSVEGQAKKRERDQKLLQLDLGDRPGHPFVLFNLGMTAHYTQDHPSAISWLQQSIEAAQPSESHVRKAYALMAGSQRHVGLDGEALSTLLKGLEVVGEDPELRFQAGLILTEMKRYDEAIEQYESISDNLSDHFSSVDVSILGYKRFHNLAAVFILKGMYREAKSFWERALQVAPDFLPCAFSLFDAAIENDDLSTAKKMMEVVASRQGHDEAWASMAWKYAEQAGGFNNAIEFLANVARQDNDAGKLVLARKLLEKGMDDAAAPYLRQLADRGLSEAAFFLGVGAIRYGDLQSAFRWTERALSLDPNHEQTKEQYENLRLALAERA